MGDRLLEAAPESHHLVWIKIIGILSALSSVYLLAIIAAAAIWRINLPGWSDILIAVLISVPTSIVAAVRWSKWMYLVTAVAVSTFLLLALGLH
jgi:hypothetical protein